MADKFYLKHSRDTIKLASKPFAGGGEGDLYKIASPSAYRRYVAKIYHKPKRTKIREEKIEYLIQHPPLDISEEGSVVWIKDIIYDSQYQFMGFIMPFVKGEKLEVLCLGKLPRKLDAKWKRFDLKAPQSLEYRLRICFNLAVAIHQMHVTEHYVLVDMKPDNIIIQPNGILSIVDTDSVEVIENGVAIYPAPVATPEYTPPEFYTADYRKHSTVGASWDRFGLAVIFYKLLFGIHPFTASSKPPYDHLVSLHEKIEHGLFVFSKEKQADFQVIPPPHKRFASLTPRLQALFLTCFEEGHTQPELRPTAEEWCVALVEAVNDPKLDAHFTNLLNKWNHYNNDKFPLPSMLLQANRAELNPKLWVEEKINNFYENPPALPITLYQMTQKGTQDVKLALESKDYVWSWGIFALALGGISFIPSYFNWIFGDFWLSSFWVINIVIISLWVFFQILVPRGISFGRYWSSNSNRLLKLWNSFQNQYPKLQKDVQKAKEHLIQKVAQVSKGKNAEFDQQEQKYWTPLTSYLKEEDKLVKALLEERKEASTTLQKSYLEKAKKHPLLAKITGNSIAHLKQKLSNNNYASEWAVQQRKIEATPELFEVYRPIHESFLKKKQHLDDALDQVQGSLMNEAMTVFDIKRFLKQHFKGMDVTYLRNLFQEKGLETLYGIGELFVSDAYIQFMCFNKRERIDNLVSINRERYTILADAFLKAYRQYESMIKQAKKEGIEYDTEYFQEVYAFKKKEHEQAVLDLETQYTPRKEQAIAQIITTEKQQFQKNIDSALELLEALEMEETAAIEVVDDRFNMDYQVIAERSQIKIDTVTQEIEEENKVFKISVESLLATPDQQKKQAKFKEAIQQTKEEIAILEKLFNENNA